MKVALKLHRANDGSLLLIDVEDVKAVEADGDGALVHAWEKFHVRQPVEEVLEALEHAHRIAKRAGLLP